MKVVMCYSTRSYLISTVLLGVTSGVVGGAFFSGHLASAYRETDGARVVIAEEMRIVDKRGKTMARVFSGSMGGRITLMDGEGKVRIMAGIDDSGETFLSFHDPHEGFRLILGTWLEGAPRVVMLDVDEQKRVALALPEGGGPRLRLTDSRGNLRFQAGLGEEGDPSLMLMDSDQTLRVQLGFTEENDMLFTFHDQTGSPRLGLGVLGDGGPVLQMADSKGSPRLTIGEAPLHDEQGAGSLPIIMILDTDGKPFWHAP